MGTIQLGDFEWDEAKARTNLEKHHVSFLEATTVFSDPHAIDAPDLYESDRFVLIGMSASSRVLFVVHAERGESIRLISVRKASPTQRRLYEKGI